MQVFSPLISIIVTFIVQFNNLSATVMHVLSVLKPHFAGQCELLVATIKTS